MKTEHIFEALNGPMTQSRESRHREIVHFLYSVIFYIRMDLYFPDYEFEQFRPSRLLEQTASKDAGETL